MPSTQQNEEFQFDIHNKKFINDDIFKPYKTFRSKYFRHIMPDIFSSIEKQLEHADDGGKLRLFADISVDAIHAIFKTGELHNTRKFAEFYDTPMTVFGEPEIDDWVAEGIKKGKHKQRWYRLKRGKGRARNNEDEQRKRFAFLNTFVLSMTNAYCTAAAIIPALEKFEELHEEAGDAGVVKACEFSLKEIQTCETYHFIDDEEETDLHNWATDAVMQYVVGFTLGLERARGRFYRKAGWTEAEIKNLSKMVDDRTDELSSYEIGRQYEEKCCNLLEEAGYLVHKTPSSGDQGADLLCEKEDVRFAVQCKHVDRAGNKAVQEVLAAVKFYQTDFAVVVSSGEFTKASRELAAANDVILINTDKLPDLYYIAR